MGCIIGSFLQKRKTKAAPVSQLYVGRRFFSWVFVAMSVRRTAPVSQLYVGHQDKTLYVNVGFCLGGFYVGFLYEIGLTRCAVKMFDVFYLKMRVTRAVIRSAPVNIIRLVRLFMQGPGPFVS